MLERAAREAGWSSVLPAGRHRGIAFTEAEGSLCAQVAELSVAESDRPTVHRVVCALDCGTIVNPALVLDQATGGTLFGLSAAMYEAVTVVDGHIDQSTFNTYRLMRMSEAPPIEVHLIASDAAPTGVGEIATAPIGAAVCNALFAATGRRVRTLPLVPLEIETCVVFGDGLRGGSGVSQVVELCDLELPADRVVAKAVHQDVNHQEKRMACHTRRSARPEYSSSSVSLLER